ncbi:MAG: hypothetical protein Q8M65_04220, partial [Rhodoglobus sp.]|nr:hypothetical protein [Rhodoglobus sp.]
LQLNYLDTQTRRRMVINTSAGTIEADLVAETLRVNESIESFVVERDGTYRAMHEAVLGGGESVAIPAEAHRTDAVIDMVEASAASRQWVDMS